MWLFLTVLWRRFYQSSGVLNDFLCDIIIWTGSGCANCCWIQVRECETWKTLAPWVFACWVYNCLLSPPEARAFYLVCWYTHSKQTRHWLPTRCRGQDCGYADRFFTKKICVMWRILVSDRGLVRTLGLYNVSLQHFNILRFFWRIVCCFFKFFFFFFASVILAPVAKCDCVATDSFLSGYPVMSLFSIWHYSESKVVSTNSEEKKIPKICKWMTD